MCSIFLLSPHSIHYVFLKFVYFLLLLSRHHLPFSLFTNCSPTKFSLSKLLLYRVLILHFQLSDLFLYPFWCFTSTLNLTDIKVNTFYLKPMISLDLNIFIYDNIVFSVMWARNRQRNSSMFLLLLTLPSHFSNK